MSRMSVAKLVVLMVVLGTAAVFLGADPWGPL
jgi:hypothetical protein